MLELCEHPLKASFLGLAGHLEPREPLWDMRRRKRRTLRGRKRRRLVAEAFDGSSDGIDVPMTNVWMMLSNSGILARGMLLLLVLLVLLLLL